MSHRNVNRSEDEFKVIEEDLEYGLVPASDEMMLQVKNESENDSVNMLEARVEKLKDDVKNLKKIRKQQEKLGKLEGKKLEILKEIQREQDRERKSKDRQHDRRKKK